MLRVYRHNAHGGVNPGREYARNDRAAISPGSFPSQDRSKKLNRILQDTIVQGALTPIPEFHPL